jgi:hypothetical protein
MCERPLQIQFRVENRVQEFRLIFTILTAPFRNSQVKKSALWNRDWIGLGRW